MATGKSPKCWAPLIWSWPLFFIGRAGAFAASCASFWRAIMKRTNREIDELIDRASAEIRDEAVDPATARTAADRVWARLSKERASVSKDPASEPARIDQIRGCADFQALIPAYLNGELSGARALLLEDHT